MSVTFSARIDSASANNAAINLTGDPAISITFTAETIGGGSGDLELDQNGGLADPDTVVYIGGVAYEFIYSFSATWPTTNSNGANQVPASLKGEPMYHIEVQDYPSSGSTTNLAFTADETITLATMDSFGNGAISVQNYNTSPAASPICFDRGTRISTSRGLVLVEDLRIDDFIITADNGPQPIVWIGSSTFSFGTENEQHRPILIAENALGKGLPNKDLVVSPQHKIVLIGTDDTEVLAPAKGLIEHRGIRVMAGRREAEYFHILLPMHSVIFAEGLATESFYAGETALKMLTLKQRRDVYAVFPSIVNNPDAYGPKARWALTVTKAEDLSEPIRSIDLQQDAPKLAYA